MERLYRRRVPPDKVITPDLALACSQLTAETGRQIGLLIDRQGRIASVVIGTSQELVIPKLARSRSGLRLLRGVRLVHTHLHNQPLTHDDLADLALLRLDLMVAIGIGEDGRPVDLYLAHILPRPRNGKVYQTWAKQSFYTFQLDCRAFIESLEQELSHENPGLREHTDTEQAVLVGIGSRYSPDAEERMAELKELVTSSGVHVLETVFQRPSAIHPKYVVGTGKLKEVVIHALHAGADLLIFDRDLTPAQVDGISHLTELKVLDRTQVILDIFARRAHTRAGKIQVELAQLRYRLPRLSQSDTAFSRLGGGIGSRGPGETKLETDRRRIRDRIKHLERELEQVTRHRDQQRKVRSRRTVPIASLVGYTNAGKSTLLNTLTKSCVPAGNRPFETLDTVNRRWYLPGIGEVILTDTVGFIRDLPEELFSAFRTTLQELEEADLLLHVVDATASDLGRHIAAVETILADLRLDRIPRLLVFNKCDRLASEQIHVLCGRYQALGISALQEETLAPLREAVAHALYATQSSIHECSKLAAPALAPLLSR